MHGCSVRVHGEVPHGVRLTGESDGHATALSGVLLTVTLADCVPVFIADPVRRTVALLHAGWRGSAAGVVEAGVATLVDAFASDPGDLAVHLGPAICGRCYEVGPEVFHALGEVPPNAPAPIDLRSAIRRRAVAAGVRGAEVTVERRVHPVRGWPIPFAPARRPGQTSWVHRNPAAGGRSCRGVKPAASASASDARGCAASSRTEGRSSTSVAATAATLPSPGTPRSRCCGAGASNRTARMWPNDRPAQRRCGVAVRRRPGSPAPLCVAPCIAALPFAQEYAGGDRIWGACARRAAYAR